MKALAHTSALIRAIAVFSLALLPLSALAVKPGSGDIPLVANVFNTVWDEQTGQGCPFPPLIDGAGFKPDAIPGATSAWDFFPVWKAVDDGLITSGLYESGTFPMSVSAYLRVEFQTNNKVFSIDTRTTAKPLRKFNLDFTDPYDPPVNQPVFGTQLATPGLFEVSGLQPITSMNVCSSTDCPEWRAIKARFWFDDPAGTENQFRVDWAFVRVLRVSSNTWYFIADACGGSQLAGLSVLEGNRTKPREVNSGYYLMPLFITVTLRQ